MQTLTPESAGASKFSPEKRFALLIGNSTYAGPAQLRNSANDARDLGQALSRVGFQSEVIIDASKDALQNALRSFIGKLQANPRSVALFYFAGHGIQIEGVNYLLPVGGVYDTPEDVKDNGIALPNLIDRLSKSEARLNLVILDSCRDNPYARKGWGTRAIGVSKGLAPIEPPSGFLVAYAAEAGAVAHDGTGRNGLYTSHLLRYLQEPGLSVWEFFARVRTGVEQDSRRLRILQTPVEYNKTTGETFYFVAPEARTGIAGLGEQDLLLLFRAARGDLHAQRQVEQRPELAAFYERTIGQDNPQAKALRYYLGDRTPKNNEIAAIHEGMRFFLDDTKEGTAQLLRLAESGNDYAWLMLLYRRLGVTSTDGQRYVREIQKRQLIIPRLADLAWNKRTPLEERRIAIWWCSHVAQFRSTAAPQKFRGNCQSARFPAEKDLPEIAALLIENYVPIQLEFLTPTLEEGAIGADMFGVLDEPLFRNIRIAADQGFAPAQVAMARADADGIYKGERQYLVPKNEARSIEWLSKAVALGHVSANFRLGVHLTENGVSRSEREKGVALLRSAAELGDASAKMYLAALYANAWIVRQDLSAARLLIRDASSLAIVREDFLPPPDFRIDENGIAVPNPYFAQSKEGDTWGNIRLPGTMLKDGGGRVWLRVDQVNLVGNTIFADSELKIEATQYLASMAAKLPPDSRKDQAILVSLDDLNDIADIVRRYYRERGYFLANTYLAEEQEQGRLRIMILEGRIGKARIRQDPSAPCLPNNVADEFLAQMITDGDLITEDHLYRPLAFANALPCRVGSFSIKPSGKVGYADVEVVLERNQQTQRLSQAVESKPQTTPMEETELSPGQGIRYIFRNVWNTLFGK